MIWIGPTDTSVLYVNGTNSEVDGGVELWVSDTSSFEDGYRLLCARERGN